MRLRRHAAAAVAHHGPRQLGLGLLGPQTAEAPIGVQAGDRVIVEMSPYDLTRGRISFRQTGQALVIDLPETLPTRHASAFKITFS